MKNHSPASKSPLIFIISLVIILTSLISACNTPLQGSSAPPSSESDASVNERLTALESKLQALIQDNSLADARQNKELSEMRSAISSLSQSSNNATEPPQKKTFTYTLKEGKATIVSIASDAESLVIPAVIDGHKVASIASDAFSGSTVHSIVISSGIESLDWFAFRNCTALKSISIPKSVRSIGYGAFDNTSPSLTVSCSRDSFAREYCQSYGITYDIVSEPLQT